MFSGVVSSSVVFAGQGTPVQCCDEESAPANPVNEAECAECSCLSCVFAIHLSDPVDSATAVIFSPQQWLTLTKHPSGYLRSIDYPPESV
jgi:hypothetical protein